MAPPRRNVELKARDPDPERSLERCVALGAEDRGELRQRDTYFAARRGRLKLREQEPGAAELIAYERADEAQARESRYRIAPVREPEALREALDAALGTVVVVDKRRRLFLWQGVRIHLDRVEGLGAFVELEGVAAAGSDLAREADQVARLRAELDIGDAAIEAASYSDLLRGAGASADGADELLRAAEAVMANAHVPYSHFPVGAGRGGGEAGEGNRPRPVLALPGRRGAAHARRRDPRRGERRERRLPAGPVRRGVGDRGDGRGRGDRDRRGRRHRRAARHLPALRRLPPAPRGVRAARDAGPPRAARRSARHGDPRRAAAARVRSGGAGM